MSSSRSSVSTSKPKLIDLGQTSHGNKNLLLSLFRKPIEKTLSIDTINNLYSNIQFGDVKEYYFQACLDTIGTNYNLSEMDAQRIPTTGPVVVVANHPFGGIEGIILGQIMLNIRRDVRILANYLLTYIPEISDFIIPVDPFGKKSSIEKNARAFREAVRWLKDGGLLVTFPSGTVSHLNLLRREVSDPKWQPHIAALVRHSKSSVLPVYFAGRNGALFQILGLIHSRLRTAMLPRELINKNKKTIQVHVGRPVTWNKLSRFESNEDMINFVRMNTYVQKNRSKGSLSSIIGDETESVSIIRAISRSHLKREIHHLPSENLLIDTDDFSVYMAQAEQIPEILREIGRLRELTFRSVREGTGKEMDIDVFDEHYVHLFLWNKEESAIGGAYRLGLISDLFSRFGPSGLYTNTLFHFKPGFLHFLEDGIELGRSFIVESYQKKYNCLSLLWRGIGQYIVRNPRKAILTGPVSISQDYHAISKYLMIQFLKQNNFDLTLSRHVQARNPYKFSGKRSSLSQLKPEIARDIEDVSVLVSEIEHDGKGIPTLLRYYLRLNAKLLSFNVDADFSDVVDGLILVDLKQTDPKLLKRFMGLEGYKKFAEAHKLKPGMN